MKYVRDIGLVVFVLVLLGLSHYIVYQAGTERVEFTVSNSEDQPVLMFTSPTPPTPIFKHAYSFQLTAVLTQATTSKLNFKLADPYHHGLPDGLFLHDDGTIDGTPLERGTFNVDVAVEVPGVGACQQTFNWEIK